MLGFAPLGSEPLGIAPAVTVIVVPPDPGGLITVAPSRTVNFDGGTNRVAFDGGTNRVDF